MIINRTPSVSKFQLHSDTVLSFLDQEQKKPDAEKIIYPHQIEAVLAVKKYFADTQIPDKPALVVAPTGAGKTGIVALLPYVLASPKVMILSPSLIITNQLEKEFGLRNDIATECFFYQRGILSENDLNGFLESGKKIDKTESIKNMKKYNLVIVNAQKFGRNSSASLNEPDDSDEEEVGMQLLKTKENFSSFTTLIVDEAHHYPAETWDLIYNQFKGKQIIFLTATPFRGSECKQLWENQKITYQISRQILVDKKIIRPLIYHNMSSDLVEREDGVIEYGLIERQILEILDNHDRKEPSVRHKAMVLTSSQDSAEAGAKAIEVATYYTSDRKTERNLKQFEDSQFRVIFVCGRLLEGYDNSDVSLCVILRNVGVLGLFTQFVGRCIRISKKLPNNRTDSITAVVASIPIYKQEKKFNDYMAN